MSEVATRLDLHPARIKQWRDRLLDTVNDVFEGKLKTSKGPESDIKPLYVKPVADTCKWIADGRRDCAGQCQTISIRDGAALDQILTVAEGHGVGQFRLRDQDRACLAP